jgi:F0F1-type ATP synthase assembly protein I
MLATFLTIIIPGLGHLYYGYNKKAFLLIGSSIVAAYFLPLYLVLYPYAFYDIWRISKQSPIPKHKRSEAIKIVLIGLLLPIMLIVLWAISIPYFITYYQNKIVFPRQVISEGHDIIDSLERYHERFGKYPEKLSSVIGQNPLRKRWEVDSWGNPYYYSTNELLDTYTLLSSGSDGIMGTDDDHVIKRAESMQ